MNPLYQIGFIELYIAHGEILEYNIFVARYPKQLIDTIRRLRSEGKTYGEIQQSIHIRIPKSSLSWQCKNVILPKNYQERINMLNTTSLTKGRMIGAEINRLKRERFFQLIQKINTPIAKRVRDVSIGKIAIAMLCLGEASKYNPKTRRAFSLGNSDPRIIIIFLQLLKKCFPFHIEKLRATVQCRADQDAITLKNFWQKTTRIPEHLFYKPLIDPRTKGKPTKKANYHGVLRIDYFDTKVQLELESLSDLIYNELHS